MRTRLLLSLIVLLTTALAVIIFINLPSPLRWWGAGIGVLSLILLWLLYRSTVKPVIVARRGLDLLAAQDFNNRLIKVGEPGADKIVTLFNDLMTRLKNERLRIREQDSFMKLLVDASPMGIIMLNLDDKIAMVNPALRRIADISPDIELKGEAMTIIDSPVIADLCSIPSGESKIIRLDGSRLYRGYHLWFMQDGFRRHFYMIETLTDEVRKAEKDAYEKVIRMISHEVNNTMGSVQSVLEILADEMTGDDEMTDTIDSCRERSSQMCSFIDAFADLARIPEPNLTHINLDEEIRKMLPFLRLMIPENVQLEFNGDSVIVSADISLLQQVIVNIVKNAVESIDPVDNEHKFIRIESLREKTGGSLCISNNGEAISDQTAAKLFTPFFSTKRSGRGLGLTLISDVLHKHGCSFTLRTDQDSITRFRINFPI